MILRCELCGRKEPMHLGNCPNHPKNLKLMGKLEAPKPVVEEPKVEEPEVEEVKEEEPKEEKPKEEKPKKKPKAKKSKK